MATRPNNWRSYFAPSFVTYVNALARQLLPLLRE